jgi:GDP/UDP-N,N'-diacetylbacillosamine 2-epimerase (hydrolysing)
MQGLLDAPGVTLQVIATGMHLSPEFGLTYREIEGDGFRIDRKVEMLLSSDTATGVAKAMGLGLIGFADALEELRPDLVVVLGDRFEILSAIAACLVARIPVAHLHGGEITEGAFDDAIRHSITKMSHFHFVAAADYRRRVIQLGEDPARVHVVGGLGVDGIKRLKLLSRAELETRLGFTFGPRTLLITFHPATLDTENPDRQMLELLAALDQLKDTHLIFTMPNADTAGRALLALVDRFVATHPNARAYTSLGQLAYLSCMQQVDAVVGNSSSGLLEMPTFGKPTVNIGDRQRGRLKAASVIDTPPERDAIQAAIELATSAAFRSQAKRAENPYGDGGASDRVVHLLQSVPLTNAWQKSFHDLG